MNTKPPQNDQRTKAAAVDAFTSWLDPKPPEMEVDHALATAPAVSADQSRPSLDGDGRVRPSSVFLRMQIGALVRRSVNECAGTHTHAEFFDALGRDLEAAGHEIVRKL